MPGEYSHEDTRKTAVLLGLPTAFVKKDYYVTSAIEAVMKVKSEYFSLAFQGGTSLSKAFKLIKRMSEDVDFRIIMKQATHALGKNAKRAALREFRHEIIDSLRRAGFDIGSDDYKVFYEGRYMSIKAAFPESNHLSYLRPHVAVDFFLGNVVLPVETKMITTLTKEVLGNQSLHYFFEVPCIAINETAAEKWVALTRRVANTNEKERLSDKYLVRHLYDLHHILDSGILTNEYLKVVKSAIETDMKIFKKQSAHYQEAPLMTSREAIKTLATEKHWQHHWELFLAQMVYEENKPSYEEAITQLRNMSKAIFSEINLQ